MTTGLKGGCLCGAVRFEADLKADTVSVCHCGMCRRSGAGPFMAAETTGPIRFEKDGALTVYASSEWGERGFCGRCGAAVFWRMKDGAFISVNPYALDDAPGLTLEHEIFIDAKPDHYAFAGDHPRLTEAQVLAMFGAGEGT